MRGEQPGPDSAVDFVVDDGTPGQPADDLPPDTGHSRRFGLVLLAVAVIVGGVLVTRGSTSRSAGPEPTVSPSTSTRPTARPTVPPAGCPVRARCVVVRTVPASVDEAVRADFPGARVGSVLSVVTVGGTEFGSPLVARRIAFTVGRTSISISMSQRRCVDTEAGDRVTQQFLDRTISTLLVKAVPGDVEGDVARNRAGQGAADAYCFLDSILVEQPRGERPIRTRMLDRLAVDAALREIG